MPRKYVRITKSKAMSWAFRQLPFWDRVKAQTVVEASGCHVFTGSKDDCGYGRINKDGKLVRLHREVWKKEHGKIGKKNVICHTCDNPACINPDHLFIGNQEDNIADMDKKGRRISLFGSDHGMAKLTEKMIPAIRQMLKRGDTCQDIAKLFGVTDMTIRHIKKGRTWKHVT